MIFVNKDGVSLLSLNEMKGFKAQLYVRKVKIIVQRNEALKYDVVFWLVKVSSDMHERLRDY